MKKPPLILDLDGTLIRNDLTFELFVLCARWNPFLLIYALFRAIGDRPGAKRMLADRFKDQIDPADLPYQDEVLDLAKQYKNDGHDVELVSGSDETLVKAISDYHGFSAYRGTEPGKNLTSHNKAAYLRERHGEDFLYAGNSTADYAVWRAGQGGYGISAPSKSYQLTRDDGSEVQVKQLKARRSELPALIKSLRMHQWAKNALLFVVPAIQVVNLTQFDFIKLFWAFFCFSLLASATYVLNDLFDLQDDRKHRTKRHRPLASGHLSVPIAVWFVLFAIPTSLALAFLIESAFGWASVAYFSVAAAYSFRLKRLAVADVFTLSGLFSLRVIAGAYVVGFPPSGWLLTFIGSFFLSLAIGKRFVEIRALAPNTAVAGQGYTSDDAIPMLTAGVAIGTIPVLAVLIYGLSAPITVFQSETVVLVGSAILLAWLLRFWLLAWRGEVSDDPVVYAFKDKTSLVMLSMVTLIFAYDLTGPLWRNLF